MFKVGDKVKIVKPEKGFPELKGRLGVIESKFDEEYDWKVEHSDGLHGKYTPVNECEIELVSKRGRPKKIKYIAQFVIDEDPVKEFYSRKELMKWLKQCEDEGVEWDSIKVYPVDKVMKPYKNIKISLRKV